MVVANLVHVNYLYTFDSNWQRPSSLAKLSLALIIAESMNLNRKDLDGGVGAVMVVMNHPPEKMR